ncbi:hypothetical protein HBH56_104980 [Parastagonospora nodorum]|uniref:Uncharacterized protein n=2 Tax=Phaeosphaeria nodorum (strain SN15 / ATCC MYA-4574 / FGSC 10173) TaxID=321614 RepID=A0A7U2FGA7_PHANO|nr:hypothetical protein SNOG_10662 [Parastagonospora nodorum SN15]KAH3913584.1 hypothetical protein HBH56_104980 [Parastagonospora nodorum]EAT82056.1 hypothetical protein SNOG_10662 [Parastagonospora nodorum SN15]KAH3929525.1 hypothetical protein HBH54_125430 [Parastagonospora nodorum]KAH3951729.1 hypothetical protein HBH53_059430 [Parastagonospora nodorum]KAH3975317.1 hypothetical protein HBH52_127430 [Parastagonospora nodorum]
MDPITKDIKDADVYNVITDIMDVVHFAAATPVKALRGARSKPGVELENSKSSLQESMHRLINSPHEQPQAQPQLQLSGKAVSALRTLYTAVQRRKDCIPEESEAAGKELEAALLHAVMALDPSRNFPEEEVNENPDDKQGREMLSTHMQYKTTDAPIIADTSVRTTRKSKRLAALPAKRYNDEEEEDDMEALVDPDNTNSPVNDGEREGDEDEVMQ